MRIRSISLSLGTDVTSRCLSLPGRSVDGYINTKPSARQNDLLTPKPHKSDTCKLANAYPVPGCRAAGCGHDARKDRTSCTAYPYNPVTAACAAGSLVHTRFIANTTDRKNPVNQVSVRTLAACGTTKKLLASLPRGASGVAGLAGSGLALPPRALATGGVVLSTTAPYTVLRPDVYRPFVAAFGKAVAAQWEYAQKPRQVKPVPPFGLCYDARTLANTRLGYIYMVPRVTLALDGGKNWTMTGVNSMVNVKPGRKACLAFVEMKPGDGKAPAAVIIGGFQMENFVLQFDLEKKRFGFVKLPYYANCGHFNFTRS